MATYDEQIAEHEAAIALLRHRKAAVEAALRESVKPVWKFTITPVSLKQFGEECWDDMLVGYRLAGEITNKEELESVGARPADHAEGGMTYIFNKSTNKFAMPTGGGRIFIQTRGTFAKPAKVEHGHKTLALLATFIQLEPSGGDVTEIIEEHQNFPNE